MKKRQLTTTKKPPTERIIKDIRSLRDSGKSDIEIRETLGIELRTFQRYTKTIYEEDKQLWFSITKEQVGSELLRLKNALEETYRISLAMAKDPEYEDRLSALQAKDDSRLNIIKLLVEYPDFERNNHAINEQNSLPELEQDDTNTVKASTLKRIH